VKRTGAVAIFLLCIGAAFVAGLCSGKKSDVPTAPMPQVAAALPTVASNPATTQEKAALYPVVKVVDGDTIDVSVNGEKIRVRLIGLDTPEIVDPRKPVQCFGREASEKAHEILDGTSVRLEMDPSQGDLDKYGRTLAYVFLKDWTNFAELMITEGYGHEYTYNLPYRYQAEFKAAEAEAREEKKGLWAGACGSPP